MQELGELSTEPSISRETSKMNTSPLDPRDISSEFWAIVDQAGRDRIKMRELLEQMTLEEMVAFHRQFFDAAMAVATAEHVAWMAPGTSEDGADDVSRWVVAQGREFFLGVLDHPETTPVDVENFDSTQIFYEISPIFTSRFGKSIYEHDQE
jgi:Protein of unknown function (DUF4240)